MAERGCYPLHGRDRIVFAMSAREDLIRRRPERGSYSLLSGGRIVLYWSVEVPLFFHLHCILLKVSSYCPSTIMANLLPCLCSEFDLRIMIIYFPTHRHIHRTPSTEYGQHFSKTTSFGLLVSQNMKIHQNLENDFPPYAKTFPIEKVNRTCITFTPRPENLKRTKVWITSILHFLGVWW